jgi:KDO2-lipid IV(A) lauroyltransferase
MWLCPHFVGLDVAAAAVLLCQPRPAASIYQTQSNPVIDAAMRHGRLRLGNAEIFPRSESVKPLFRAVKQGRAFFNLPDMDFGARDAAFVPFFGVPAATLLAPSRLARMLNMVVQPVMAELLPGGQGYKVHFLPPLDNFPTDDAEDDTRRLNAYIESQILMRLPQYLWVHKRFKTRPPGEAGLY